MIKIAKSTMCHLLYCLNWHIAEQRASARNAELPAHEWKTLSERIRALNLLKGKTLAKLVSEGYASIHGTQVDFRAKPTRRFYSIRLNREYSFHFPKKEFEGLIVNEREKTRNNKVREEAQTRTS